VTPRRGALLLLVLNAALLVAIALRYDELRRAWDEYAVRRAALEIERGARP
jgi:hypothetical protein